MSIAVIVLLVLLVFAFPATAAAPVHQVSGGGKLSIGGTIEQYGFNAQIDSAGNVKGQLQTDWVIPDETFHAEISCLKVVGNTAWLGGTITQSHSTNVVLTEGTTFVFSVRDNGEGSGSSGYDQISYFFLNIDPAFCETQPSVPYGDLVEGNIQVK